MDRPDLLSPHEQHLVDAHRNAMSQVQSEKTAAAQGDMRRELENVYQELQDMAYDNPGGAMQNVMQRVYTLLY